MLYMPPCCVGLAEADSTRGRFLCTASVTGKRYNVKSWSVTAWFDGLQPHMVERKKTAVHQSSHLAMHIGLRDDRLSVCCKSHILVVSHISVINK